MQPADEHATPGGVTDAPRQNVFARFAGALFAPVQTFAEIARRPDILAPLVVMLILGYVSTAVVIPRMDFESVMAAQAEQMRKQNPKISDADLERIERFSTATVKVTTWIAPLLGIVVYAVIAGILLLAFRMLGGEGTYKEAFSATLYAWTPLLLFGIIMTVVVLARGSFDPTEAATIVKSNPAFLVDMKEQPVLFSLLSAIDVFTIWTVALLIVGFAAVSRMAVGKAAAIVISLWLVYLLVKVGFAALGAMRMNS